MPRKINYYVAISIDGFICGPDEDISGFVPEGNGVEQYLEDLKSFDTVLMGRSTYEFGYKYGMEPGQAPYPHMEHYIFSKTLKLENKSEKIHVCDYDLELIKELKQQEGTDIYLCGGGIFAAWLLENELIDVLKIKLNPLVLGDGTPLFAHTKKQYKLSLKDRALYDNGLQFITYSIQY